MRSVSEGLFSMYRSYFGVWPTMFAENSRLDRMSNWNVTVVFHGFTPDQLAVKLLL